MQQTRISQGTSYYEKFVNEFGDIFALAEADERRILKLWQGLGYYSRARNLHHTAQVIAERYEGRFPESYEELVGLKGIGDYTASAIASMAFDQPYAVVDGNVFRVLSRLFGIRTPINEPKGVREFKLLAKELLDPKDPGTHNQALMEFGALVCTPKKPKCSECCFNDSCVALQEKAVEDLPVKVKKLKVRKRFFNYLVIDNKGMHTHIRQRRGKDIWMNLFEFPLHETTNLLQEEKELERIVENDLGIQGSYTMTKYNELPMVHKLTHQTLYASFWIIRPEGEIQDLITWEELKNHPLPVLLQNFVDKYQNMN